MWNGDRSGLGNSVRSTIDATTRLSPLAESAGLPAGSPGNPVHESAYPGGQLQSVLANTSALIRADLGAKVVTIDYGNWDMHNGLGGTDPMQGWMFDQVDHLARSLVAFFADLGTAASRVTVVTLSEFGRRVEQNGDNGVDHGYGNAMLLLGGAVNGGKVYGSWPGLAAGKLTDGDLAVTTDYRALIGEILQKRCGVGDVGGVFPGVTPTGYGVVTAR
jgi:uncharacterized protein (DUF1501 family)